MGAYGEWVPVDKTSGKAAATSRKALTTSSIGTPTSLSDETTLTAGLPEVVDQPAPDNDSVFPDPKLQVRRSYAVNCVYTVFHNWLSLYKIMESPCVCL